MANFDRFPLVASAVVLVVVSCSERGLLTTSRNRTHTAVLGEATAAGTYSFTAHGASYGPQAQELTPPSGCMDGPSTHTDTVAFERQNGDVIYLRTIHNQTEGTACHFSAGSGGQPYNGGTILLTGTIEGVGKRLANVSGDFTEHTQTLDVPLDATLTFEVILNEGYHFTGWTITRADGSQYHAADLVLTRPAGTTDADYLAEFVVNPSPPPPPPPPPPDTTPSCPSCPTCDMCPG